jgi:DNA replication protein DnaC
MVEALPGRVAQAEAAPLPHLEFLELLVEDELARRADRLFARRLKQAGIGTVKTLADFEWAFNPKLPKTKLVELASARFVHTHAGVLLIGPPGIGKSHIATAIAVGAIRAGRRVLIRSTFDLVADFACRWSAVANVSWIAVLTGLPRSGDDPVAFEIAPYDGTERRAGHITVRDQVVNVVQTPR